MLFSTLRRPHQVYVAVMNFRGLRQADSKQDRRRVTFVDQFVPVAVTLWKGGDIASAQQVAPPVIDQDGFSGEHDHDLVFRASDAAMTNTPAAGSHGWR